MCSALASDFFTERELNDELHIDSAESLWHRLAFETLFVGHSPSTGYVPMYFRGQRNADWGLASSLFRMSRAARAAPVTESVMAAAEQAVLAAAKAAGLGRMMTEVQLLAVLQHHGRPTRLIDVSQGVLEALYFAVDADDAVDGRLFLLRPAYVAELSTDPPREDVVPTAGEVPVPWPDNDKAAAGKVPVWDERIAILSPPSLDARMFAQRGRLLAGGLPAPAGARTISCGSTTVPPDHWSEMTTLAFDFPKVGETQSPAWSGGGWTIRIKSAWKPTIRDLLAGWTYPVTYDLLFPALDDAANLLQTSVACESSARGLP